MLTGKNAAINSAALMQAKDKLVTLCKDIIEDGVVDQQEAETLEAWLENNEALLCEFPANVISARLCNHLADGRLDEREGRNLLQLLQRVVDEEERQKKAKPASLPYDAPQPALDFCNMDFHVLGKFALGDASTVQADIVALGGVITGEIPGQQPTVLVVGYFAAKKWQQGTLDPVIEKALKARAKGQPVMIVSEEHLMDQLISASGVCTD